MDEKLSRQRVCRRNPEITTIKQKGEKVLDNDNISQDGCILSYLFFYVNNRSYCYLCVKLFSYSTFKNPPPKHSNISSSTLPILLTQILDTASSILCFA